MQRAEKDLARRDKVRPVISEPMILSIGLAVTALVILMIFYVF